MKEEIAIREIQKRESIKQLIFSESNEDVILGVHILLKENDDFVIDFFETYGLISGRIGYRNLIYVKSFSFYDISISRSITEETATVYKKPNSNALSPVILIVDRAEHSYIGLRTEEYVNNLINLKVHNTIII